MSMSTLDAAQARQWALSAKPMRLADFEALNVPPPPLDGGLPPGEEAFGRPASPWGQLTLGAPLAGLGLMIAASVAPGGLVARFWLERLMELGAFLVLPFVLAAMGQWVGERLADQAHRRGKVWDPSARSWHPALALALLAAPWALLNLWPSGQELLLNAWLQAQLAMGGSGLVGYGFGALNLLVLLPAFAWVGWSGKGWALALPPGRLKALLRAVKRACPSGASAPERAEAVAALLPRFLAEPLAATEELDRMRAEALQRDLIASLGAEGEPDLAKANQAIAAYRMGL